MRVQKRGGSIDGKWAKTGQDIKDGERIKILDAGNLIEGDYGPRKVFKIMTLRKEEFNLNFNQTSINNLIDGYGEDTQYWVGKVAQVFVIKQMVGDGLKNVLYLAPDGWKMNEDGEFYDPQKEETPLRDEIEDNVPF